MPTPKQNQVLQIIQEFICSHGHSPTLSDIKKRMHPQISSDQTVLRHLQGLEKADLISREKDKARSIVVTPKGNVVLSVQPATDIKKRDELYLEPHQLKIKAGLAEIDPVLANIYLGGLRVLADHLNPNRISLTAHSMREVICYFKKIAENQKLISDTESEEISKSTSKRLHAVAIQRIFEPIDDRSGTQSAYDLWAQFYRYFTKLGHPNGKYVDIDEFMEQLSQFENILHMAILPRQIDIYEGIESILKKSPSQVDKKSLELILSKNFATKRYFFQKVGKKWFSFLRDNGFLISNMPVAEFLQRISSKGNVDITQIVLECPLDEANYYVREGFIKAFLTAEGDPADLFKKIKKEKWREALASHSFEGHLFQEILKDFIERDAIKPALDLVRHIFHFAKDGMKLNQFENGSLVLDDHDASEILDLLKSSKKQNIASVISCLKNILNDIICCEKDESGAIFDYSNIWRPSIAPSAQNHSFFNVKDYTLGTIAVLLERYIDFLIEQGENVPLKFSEIIECTQGFSYCERLKIHIYGKYPEQFVKEINCVILSNFNETATWTEYANLIEKNFQHATPKTKAALFKAITTDLGGEEDKYWKYKILSILEPYLEGQMLKDFKSLRAIFGTLDSDQLKFLSYHESFSGPNSPKNASELKEMSTKELGQFLLDWEKPKDEWGMEYAGLARELEKVVEADPMKFSKNAILFTNPNLRPIFVFYFFSGLGNSLRDKKKVDWEKIIEGINHLIINSKKGVLFSVSGNDRWEMEWSDAFKSIAGFIEKGLFKDSQPNIKFRKQIWDIITFLTQNSDPSGDSEKKFIEGNGDAYSMSINCTRGVAYHAVFAYMFWVFRNVKQKKGKKDFVPLEVKKMVENILKNDETLQSKAALGRHFPWLFANSPDWAAKIANQIFVQDNKDTWKAAWEGYMFGALFKEVVSFLKPQYIKAMDSLKKKRKKTRINDPDQRLTEQIMITYFFPIDEEAPTLYETFFKVANSIARGEAVSYIGRAYVTRKQFGSDFQRPPLEKLKEFWEWRLKESTDHDELKEFGYWAAKDLFENDWTAKMLISTLEKTGGDIDGDLLVFDFFRDVVDEIPDLVGTALDKVLTKRLRTGQYMYRKADLKGILSTILIKGSPESVKIAQKIQDFLLKMGYSEFKDLP